MSKKINPKLGTLHEELYALARVDLRVFIELAFKVLLPGDQFIPGQYLDALAYQLMAVARGETTRLIVNLPPRYLKSLCCSVILPAWLLGLDPTLKIVCISYSNDISAKHASDFRALIKSSLYRNIFPRTKIQRGKDTQLEVETTRRGFRLATSVDGSLTGRGGDFVIIDDPMKADDANSPAALERVQKWFAGTAYSRLDNKKTGRIVLVMQRLHVDDLTGFLAKQGRWTIVAYPATTEIDETISTGQEPWFRKAGDALHPEREPLEVLLNEVKPGLGSYQFAAQYQQNPVPLEGYLIKPEWFDRYTALPDRKATDIYIQSWDTASKEGAQNDYSVCITALKQGRVYYILDVHRSKINFPTLRRTAVRLSEQYPRTRVLVEDASSGIALIQDLKDGTSLRPIRVKCQGKKYDRAYNNTGLLESHYVLLPKTAPWADDFIAEMAAFPHGKHDDQVDALMQLLDYGEQARRTEQQVKIGPPSNVKDYRSFEEQMMYPMGYGPQQVTAIGLGTLTPDGDDFGFDTAAGAEDG